MSKCAAITAFAISMLIAPALAVTKLDIATRLVTYYVFAEKDCPDIEINLALFAKTLDNTGYKPTQITEARQEQFLAEIEKLRSDRQNSCNMLLREYGPGNTFELGLFRKR